MTGSNQNQPTLQRPNPKVVHEANFETVKNAAATLATFSNKVSNIGAIAIGNTDAHKASAIVEAHKLLEKMRASLAVIKNEIGE